MYATIFCSTGLIRQASDYQLLQQDVEALGKWPNNNYLTFNPSKMQRHGIFKKRHPLAAPSYFTLNGSRLEIEIAHSVKVLGSLMFFLNTFLENNIYFLK